MDVKTVWTLAAVAALSVTALAAAPTATADPGSGCVSQGEFNHLREGRTKQQIEAAWDVVGAGKWDHDTSTLAHDTFIYPACNQRLTLKIAFTRDTHVWVWQRSAH